jgi:hypothetical protein
LARRERWSVHARDIEALVETYLTAERDLVAAVDAAGGARSRRIGGCVLWRSNLLSRRAICTMGDICDLPSSP